MFKSDQVKSKIIRNKIKELLIAVNSLNNLKEIEKFFYSLCTIYELEELSSRLMMAKLFFNKTPISELKEIFKNNSCTLAKVLSELNTNNNGYHLLFKK